MATLATYLPYLPYLPHLPSLPSLPGLALEIVTFLGPVKWHRDDRRVPFWAQNSRDFLGPT
jgi:hypothetical protein